MSSTPTYRASDILAHDMRFVDWIAARYVMYGATSYFKRLLTVNIWRRSITFFLPSYLPYHAYHIIDAVPFPSKPIMHELELSYRHDCLMAWRAVGISK